MIRTAIVGGRRGVLHGRAYRSIEDMEVVALCELDPQLRLKASEELGVSGFADYDRMLSEVRPDVVHAVTKPTIPREIWVESAAKAGAQALVIEKPIALRPAELEALSAAVAGSGMKVIVNHQRRYMPFADKLLAFLADDSLGEIHFVRASTEGEIMDMATHLMDLVLLAVGDVPISGVWASVEGKESYAKPHLNCPDSLAANYTFQGGVRVFFESTPEAYGTVDFPDTNPRCNIDIWATNGRFWWRENGNWGYEINGDRFSARTAWKEEMMDAQVAFTQAIGEWVRDDNRPHRSRFEVAKLGYEVLLAAYHSAYRGKRVEEFRPISDMEWESLRERVLTAD